MTIVGKKVVEHAREMRHIFDTGLHMPASICGVSPSGIIRARPSLVERSHQGKLIRLVWTALLCPLFVNINSQPWAAWPRLVPDRMARIRIGGRSAKGSGEEKCRDRVGLDALYRAEAPGLRRRLYQRLRSSDEASDVVQEAFARLAGSASLNQLREPRAFLNRIVRNLLINRAALLANRAVHTALPDDLEAGPQSDPSYDLEVKQVAERYRQIVASLPPRMQEVFILNRIKDQDYEAISEQLGITVRTVRWHLTEAIIRIDQALGSDD